MYSANNFKTQWSLLFLLATGAIGDWVNHFTPEVEAKFKVWEASGGDVAQQVAFKYHMSPPSGVQ